jgi:hypothetical protein
LAIATLFLALSFAFVASSAHADTYVETDSWSPPLDSGGAPINASYGIAADPGSGDVFTGFLHAVNGTDTGFPSGRIDKWSAGGTPGTPALFGNTFSTASNYAGVAVDPTTHNVYALVDPIDRALTVPADPKIAIFQPDGTPVTSFPVSANKAVGIDVDASGNVWVPDPENGVVNKYSSTGTLLDTTSGSTLGDPMDVALDASGNLYVADHSTDAQNEIQDVDLKGATGGAFRLNFAGEHTGVDFTGDVSYGKGEGDLVVASATATRNVLAEASGDLTKGSATVSNVTGVTGTFSIGESISSGTGSSPIPFGTTIASCSPSCAAPTSLTLSQPATATEAGSPLTSGSKVLTGVTNAGDFQAGMGVTGSPTGIPFNAALFGGQLYVSTITSTNPGAETITLSDGVLSAGTNSIKGEYVTNVDTGEGAFAAGQKIKGPFNNGALLAMIAKANGGNIVVADSFPPASAPGVQIEAASPTITNVQVTSGQFATEQFLTGPNLGPGATTGIRPSAEPGESGWNLATKTETLQLQSKFTQLPFTGGGTDVTFHGDAIYSASSGEETSARTFFVSDLEALPTIGAAKSFNAFSLRRAETASVDVPGGTSRAVVFQNAMGARDLPEMTCESAPGNPLTGGSGGCSVTTTQDGSSTPGRVAKFNPGGNFVSNFVPPTGNYTADAVAVDKSTGDVFVAGGNGDWANPHGVISGPDAPDFSVKRYDSGGNELGQLGLGDLAAQTYVTSDVAKPLGGGAAFGLNYDSTAHKLYTVGRATDLTYQTDGSVVRVYSVGHTLTVDAAGTGNGSVAADSGTISACETAGGGTCSDDYADGTSVTLHSTAGALTTFNGWTVTGQPGACPGIGDCTVTINADTNVQATFTLNQHNLTVVKDGGGTGTVTSTPAGIDCGATCGPIAFDEASSVTLHAVPSGASTFVGWTVTGQPGACPGTGDCAVTINADTTVHAQFTQPQPLTIAKEGTGTGTVTSTPAGIDCGATCGPVTFPEGSSVELTATPDAHQTFETWSGGGCSGQGTCTVTMNSPTTVHATFTQITHNVSVVKNGSGSGTVSGGPINCGAACSAPAPEGTPIVLTATPASHSSLTSWSGCDSSTGNQCTVNVDAVESVTATFDLVLHTLTVTPSGNGAGTVDADAGLIAGCSSGGGVCTDPDVVDGSSVTLTATPGAHSTVAWSGCGSVSGNQCTVTVEADINPTATFTLKTHTLTVSKSGSGSGSVSCDGGACASSYPEGSTVTIAATPDSGSDFAGWSGAGCSGAGPCTVTIDADRAVSATFNAKPATGPGPTPGPTPTPNPLKCKKGFHKKKVHGKVRCVKTKHRKRKGH